MTTIDEQMAVLLSVRNRLQECAADVMKIHPALGSLLYSISGYMFSLFWSALEIKDGNLGYADPIERLYEASKEITRYELARMLGLEQTTGWPNHDH